MSDRPLFLMTDPQHFGVFYRINPWMEPGTWNTDSSASRAAALAASDRLRASLRAMGAEVELLPPVAGLPDLVFPANAAVVLDGKALVARFKHPERQGEEEVFRSAFLTLKQRGVLSEIIELPPDVLQEGAGDCIWDAGRRLFWAGFGQRSTANSLDAIKSAFSQDVVGLELASPRFYHLDTCFCSLSGGQVLYHPPAFTPAALAQIHGHVAPDDRIEASKEEAAAFCVNAVNIADQIVMAQAPLSLRRKLMAHGYRLQEVDLAPFILSGGGAYCMTLRLDLRSESAARMRAAE